GLVSDFAAPVSQPVSHDTFSLALADTPAVAETGIGPSTVEGNGVDRPAPVSEGTVTGSAQAPALDHAVNQPLLGHPLAKNGLGNLLSRLTPRPQQGADSGRSDTGGPGVGESVHAPGSGDATGTRDNSGRPWEFLSATSQIQQIPDTSGPSVFRAIKHADFNNDGRLDFVVTQARSNAGVDGTPYR